MSINDGYYQTCKFFPGTSAGVVYSFFRAIQHFCDPLNSYFTHIINIIYEKILTNLFVFQGENSHGARHSRLLSESRFIAQGTLILARNLLAFFRLFVRKNANTCIKCPLMRFQKSSGNFKRVPPFGRVLLLNSARC